MIRSASDSRCGGQHNLGEGTAPGTREVETGNLIQYSQIGPGAGE